ncbi:hypothetical protein [Pinisolibacter aquiterrae]|uniref:hypothetical protein n=1 Tax=Pinisolibacter aquiterrae TaxID=2815579 RepID=UPI001C3D4488|nr:hypothetical protein [Pinisolibacter aquiterrae]MBV5264512.1 hypothetical protein [Pinisolibacter aquiterrae]MCC8235712.1 hypothetical protein [Pinisolibacter aquiterrae]
MSQPSRIVIAALAGLVLVAAPVPVRAGAVFDGFLEGMDDGCRQSPAFQAFEQSLVARHTPPIRRGTKIAAPADLAAAIGPAAAVDKGEWVEVSVPLDGTWRGVAVKRFVFSLGKENGIHAWAVEFAAPAEAVTATFAERVKRSNAAMAVEYAEIEASTGLDLDGRAALYCDLSN